MQSVGLQGRTSLHEACGRGYFLLASLLLQHGGDIHLEDEFHRTALRLAVKGNKHYPDLQEDLECYASLEEEAPGHLTSLCRKAIRKYMGNVGVKKRTEKLPLPTTIKEYLLYCDMPLWPLFKDEQFRYTGRIDESMT